MQGLPSSQERLAPAAQTPLAQRSFWVQALPSSQGAVLLVWAQPLPGLQVSLVHRLVSSQEMVGPLLQVPASQASPLVQALPSSQAPVRGV